MKIICAGALAVAVASTLFAAGAPAPPALTISAVRAAKPPVIDGDLSDEIWQKATEITGFTQHDPDDGKPATQKTIVKVAYDDNAPYIAAKLEDTNAVTSPHGRSDTDLASYWLLSLGAA